MKTICGGGALLGEGGAILERGAILTNVGLSLGLSTAMSGIDKKVHGYGAKTIKLSNKDLAKMIRLKL